MKRNVLIVCVFVLTVYSTYAQTSPEIREQWNKAQVEHENKNYKAAVDIYSQISADLDSLYEDINSVKVEDLRQTYSIDELKIENKQKANQLLRYGLIAAIILIIVMCVCFSILTGQRKKLLQSQARLQRAKDLAEKSIYNKSLFLSNMSHEIRTPLNALSGFSSVLTEPGIDEATRAQCNGVIKQNSKLLLDLINDVIDISCMDISQMQFNIKECNVVALCQNVVNTLDGIKQTQAGIVYRSVYPSLQIETDTVRLQQVLINILVNATKFTKEGIIILKLEKVEDDIAEFSVTDTGCGIPLDEQKKIFSRFEKLNEEAQGSGIGLSICQDIINHLGGEIWIDSSYTEGTRFVFTHPLKQTKQQ